MSDSVQNNKSDKSQLTGMARRIANLRRGNPEYHWKPGESGNPTGKPKIITEAYNRLLRMQVPDELLVDKFLGLRGSGVTFADLLALNVTMKATVGGCKAGTQMAAAKEITERVEGKVPLRVAGADGGALEIVTMTDEERKQRLINMTECEIIEGEIMEIPKLLEE